MAASATRELEQAQRWFRALGDATRLRLLGLLRDGEQCVCDLTDTLDTSQSLLSFHLKALKDAGLVSDRRQGRWIYYALRPEAIEALRRFLGDLNPTRSTLRTASRLNRC